MVGKKKNNEVRKGGREEGKRLDRNKRRKRGHNDRGEE